MTEHLFTSESVSEGHPDKIADQISDAILDAILRQDPKARVACETFVKTGMVLVGGEITTDAWVDVDHITREVIKEIGYNHSEMGFKFIQVRLWICHYKRVDPHRTFLNLFQGIQATQEC